MSTISNTVETNFSFTVSNINALNKVLKTVEDIQKKSQINLKIQDSKEHVKGLSDNLTKYNNIQRESVKQNQAVSIQANRTANSIRDLSGSYMALRQAMAIKQEINQAINELKRIDETMFNLGVVAGKTGKEIDIMKYEFIDMAKNFPKSAEDIAKAVDILTRSGLDFDSSVRGIDAAIKLAVSSGEDLSSVASINRHCA